MNSIQCSTVDSSIKVKFLIKELLTLKQGENKAINECLSELNHVDHRMLLASNHDAVMLLVNQLCAFIQATETALVKTTSNFLTTLMKNGANFQDRTLIVCKRWILETLEYSELISQADVLVALKNLLATSPFSAINQELRKLLGENGLLWRFLCNSSLESQEIRFQALGCLQAIIVNKEKSQSTISTEYLLKIKEEVMRIISLSSENNDMYFKQNICICLRILRVIMFEKTVVNSLDNLGEILGIIQAFLFYGIKDYSPIIPKKLHLAAMNLPENLNTVSRTKNTKNHKIKSRKQLSKKSISDVPYDTLIESKIITKFSSDSDTSDTEAAASAIHLEWKIRLETMQLFYNIVLNTSSRELFGYWTQIVASGSHMNARVLTRLILKEPSYKVRQIAWNALSELLRGARNILLHAEDVEHASFVTFFTVVSSVIKEFHFTVSSSLRTERNIAVLTHGLKCTSALVESTPYHRLKPGLVSMLIRNCRNHVLHKDPTVRVAALGIFEALASLEPITSEILNIFGISFETDNCLHLLDDSLMNNTNDEEEECVEGSNRCDHLQNYDGKVGDKEISPILQICLSNISDESISVPVRLQTLKLLGMLAQNVENLVFHHLETVVRKLIAATKESEPQIVLHACRVIDIISKRLVAPKADDCNILLFWKIICDPIISLLQHSEAILKEVACDCLGNIDSTVFAQLTREKNILIITLLFGATRDSESAVRAASLRTLGLLVSLPVLEEDAGFLMDLADITCSTLQDVNLGVRIKAAWTLASLCDHLIKRANNDEVEPVSLDILIPQIYESSVKATKDSDKVKCNATRAIGSILFLCSDNNILKDTSEGLEALIQCATVGSDQKVRWNACHAIGLILSHDPDRILPTSWKDQVFPTLCNLVCSCSNFKVRTNAAWALSVCKSYGKHIIFLWKSIILALENSQHVPNYIEYSHRDILVQQLCLTLSHLAIHTDMNDLLNLWSEIGDHIEDVSTYMKQFQNHVLPEKADDLTNAKIRFSKHERDASTKAEKEISRKLKNLFGRKDSEENFNIKI